ncbi:YHS domain-containing protein [Bowmanella sp. Y26]|uniref:YHS domain-containing protein n=1 Tax=Bowmanella yangjiangensis TaxID=2811230 RepID=A0ABS3CTH0_9ALTE|nr:YHS domain-containing (seleno)protein [Bowmanella yangjiangensis]MBN7819809.1 YHS domain-containing protein [Bowmanella yangjiangensis]MBT1063347.1 YHS domain-containing protein [Bowmanella yangjiangensis]
MKLTNITKALFLAAGMATSTLSFAADIGMNADANDIAIKGYDTVAYFTKGKAVQGSNKFTATHKGAIYHFSSAENRDLFRSAPERYAPQFGGYCAMGVALEKKLDTDPTAFKVVDGKLYLNLNKTVQQKWMTDIPGYINSAENIWVDIKRKDAEVLNAD